jgi:hypothetical protein
MEAEQRAKPLLRGKCGYVSPYPEPPRNPRLVDRRFGSRADPPIDTAVMNVAALRAFYAGKIDAAKQDKDMEPAWSHAGVLTVRNCVNCGQGLKRTRAQMNENGEPVHLPNCPSPYRGAYSWGHDDPEDLSTVRGMILPTHALVRSSGSHRPV